MLRINKNFTNNLEFLIIHGMPSIDHVPSIKNALAMDKMEQEAMYFILGNFSYLPGGYQRLSALIEEADHGLLYIPGGDSSITANTMPGAVQNHLMFTAGKNKTKVMVIPGGCTIEPEGITSRTWENSRSLCHEIIHNYREFKPDVVISWGAPSYHYYSSDDQKFVYGDKIDCNNVMLLDFLMEIHAPGTIICNGNQYAEASYTIRGLVNHYSQKTELICLEQDGIHWEQV